MKPESGLPFQISDKAVSLSSAFLHYAHTHTHTHTLRSIACIWHIRRKLSSSRSSSVTPKKLTAASSKLMQICPFRVERVNAQKHTSPCMQGHTHTHTHTRENTDNVNTYAQMDTHISIYKCQAASSLAVGQPNVSSDCHGKDSRPRCSPSTQSNTSWHTTITL